MSPEDPGPEAPGPVDMLGPIGVWWGTDGLRADDAVAFAQRIERLGYAALWIPETVGRDPFAHGALLLSETTDLVVATGIANIFHRHPGAMVQAQHTLAEQSGDRFLLGIGVSHEPLVAGVRKLDYSKPYSTMVDYLDGMNGFRYRSHRPTRRPKTVLAALGPKMLALGGSAADGVHPYWTTPEHTATARAAVGPDKLVCVEQKVVFSSDPAEARATAREALGAYAGLPNYFRNWFRLGFDESDLADGGSDRLIDALVPWGGADSIRARVQEHLDAGADHVCIQPLTPGAAMRAPHGDALDALAPT